VLRQLLATAAAIYVCVVGVGLYSTWDGSKNRGYKFGYFGEFNRAKEALLGIPGVSVRGSYNNLDVGLEEFGFDADFRGQRLKIDIEESDPMRLLSVAEMREELFRRHPELRARY
jgi:hypothetical protein